MSVAPGEGSTLKVTITATPTVIAQVTSLTPPGLKRPAVSKTDLSSTIQERRPGLLDVSELELTINYDPSAPTHAYLTTSILGGLTEAWLVTFADSGTATYGFSGFVTEFIPESLEVDGNATATVKIQPTTTITITP